MTFLVCYYFPFKGTGSLEETVQFCPFAQKELDLLLHLRIMKIVFV